MVIRRRAMALAGVLLMFLSAMSLPLVSADWYSGDYQTPGGVQNGDWWLTVYPCGVVVGSCDLDDDGADDVGIGGNHFVLPRSYQKAEIIVQDVAVYHTDVGMIANLWGSPEAHEHGCGSGFRISTSGSYSQASVWIFGLMVTDSYGICAGTAGKIHLHAW